MALVLLRLFDYYHSNSHLTGKFGAQGRDLISRDWTKGGKRVEDVPVPPPDPGGRSDRRGRTPARPRPVVHRIPAGHRDCRGRPAACHRCRTGGLPPRTGGHRDRLPPRVGCRPVPLQPGDYRPARRTGRRLNRYRSTLADPAVPGDCLTCRARLHLILALSNSHLILDEVLHRPGQDAAAPPVGQLMEVPTVDCNASVANAS